MVVPQNLAIEDKAVESVGNFLDMEKADTLLVADTLLEVRLVKDLLNISLV